MTNLEKLQKASLEELAELLTKLTEYIETGGETYWSSPYDCGLPRSCAKRDFIKWLKEEASEY